MKPTESTSFTKYTKLITTDVTQVSGIIFFNFSTPCILNVNNTGTKYVRVMKQTAF